MGVNINRNFNFFELNPTNCWDIKKGARENPERPTG